MTKWLLLNIIFYFYSGNRNRLCENCRVKIHVIQVDTFYLLWTETYKRIDDKYLQIRYLKLFVKQKNKKYLVNRRENSKIANNVKTSFQNKLRAL